MNEADEVLIVPAREAYTMYRRLAAYICQADRSFRPVQRIAFYTDEAIQRHVPKVRKVFDSVVLSGPMIRKRDDLSDEDKKELQQVTARLSQDRHPSYGEELKVVLLSGPADGDTVLLPLDRFTPTIRHAHGSLSPRRGCGFCAARRRIAGGTIRDTPSLRAWLSSLRSATGPDEPVPRPAHPAPAPTARPD